MKLIIIDGPIASGKTIIANALYDHIKPTPVLIIGCNLYAAQKLIDIEKPETIILDELCQFTKKTIEYLKSKADKIKYITIREE